MKSQTIGDYDIVHALGQGAAGAVYLVRSRETGKQYAMKLLHPNEADKPRMNDRFIREALVLKDLNHPNIVGFVDCGIEDCSYYIVMELVECGSLKSAMRNFGKFPWRTAVKVAGQISEGLAHAHSKGVIHRDLKPANIFLSTNGQVKIGDFGLVRDLNRQRLTIERAAIGTCRYMAPELIRCEEGITGKVDLYALGTVIYQMIVGEPMFNGANHGEVFDAHLNSKPPRLKDKLPECPDALSKLVDELVAKAPAARPKDGKEVSSRLLQILRENPSEESRADHEALRRKRAEIQEDTVDDVSLETLSDSTHQDSTIH